MSGCAVVSAPGSAPSRPEPAVKTEAHAACHHAIAAFVEQRTSAADFLIRFRHLSGGEVADPSLDGALKSIRELTERYARSLPPGAEPRVSEAQFRIEVRHVASLRGVSAAATSG